MKNLELNELVEIQGGGKNNTCSKIGDVAFAFILYIPWTCWGGTAAFGSAYGMAAVYGCFH